MSIAEPRTSTASARFARSNALIMGKMLRKPLLVCGIIVICLGLTLHTMGFFAVMPRFMFGMNELLLRPNHWIGWYTSVPVILGAGRLDGSIPLFSPRQIQ